jgi:hypothetical protein
MAEFFKAQFDTSAHFLGVIKSYAATWLGLGASPCPGGMSRIRS